MESKIWLAQIAFNSPLVVYSWICSETGRGLFSNSITYKNKMTRPGALFFGKRDGYGWYKSKLFIFEFGIIENNPIL